MTSVDADKLLRVAQVAKAFDITERHLQKLAEKGLIPSIRLGERALRFDPVQLRTWLEAGGVKSEIKPKRRSR